jgi:hypothetical protein
MPGQELSRGCLGSILPERGDAAPVYSQPAHVETVNAMSVSQNALVRRLDYGESSARFDREIFFDQYRHGR